MVTCYKSMDYYQKNAGGSGEFMKALKILLIEDDLDDRFFLKELLEKSDFKVTVDEAECSSAGLEKLNANSYDCVLVDYIIPRMSGLEVIKTTRKTGVTTPFIILTGYGDEELGSELIRQGASDYLCKGDLNVETLQGKIKKAIDVS